MSQVTEQSVRFQTALASIKLIQASAVLDLTEDDFDFLTSNKVWIATDRSRARRCVEACVYGTLDLNIRHNLSSSKGPKPLQLKLLTTYIPKTSAFTLAFSTSQRLRTTRASARTFFTFRHYITPSARNF